MALETNKFEPGMNNSALETNYHVILGYMCAHDLKVYVCTHLQD